MVYLCVKWVTCWLDISHNPWVSDRSNIVICQLRKLDYLSIYGLPGKASENQWIWLDEWKYRKIKWQFIERIAQPNCGSSSKMGCFETLYLWLTFYEPLIFKFTESIEQFLFQNQFSVKKTLRKMVYKWIHLHFSWKFVIWNKIGLVFLQFQRNQFVENKRSFKNKGRTFLFNVNLYTERTHFSSYLIFLIHRLFFSFDKSGHKLTTIINSYFMIFSPT